jgi:glutamate synthase (NADPH/NADH) large chain
MHTASTVASSMLEDFEATAAEFVRVLPRDFAAVMETRAIAVDEGLDPDGTIVWERIMEVTHG